MEILKVCLNISAGSNNFWEHYSRVPPLFAPMLHWLVHYAYGSGARSFALMEWQLDTGLGDACNKERNINCFIFSYFNMNLIFPLENHKAKVDVGSQHSWLFVGLTVVLA